MIDSGKRLTEGRVTTRERMRKQLATLFNKVDAWLNGGAEVTMKELRYMETLLKKLVPDAKTSIEVSSADYRRLSDAELDAFIRDARDRLAREGEASGPAEPTGVH